MGKGRQREPDSLKRPSLLHSQILIGHRPGFSGQRASWMSYPLGAVVHPTLCGQHLPVNESHPGSPLPKSRPRPLITTLASPTPDDFLPAFALLPVGCCLITRGPASANPSLGHCGDINRRQRRPLMPRDPHRQPGSYVLLLKRPLHIRLCKRQSHTRPKLSMFFLQGNVQGNAPRYSGPVKAVFMTLAELRKGVELTRGSKSCICHSL